MTFKDDKHKCWPQPVANYPTTSLLRSVGFDSDCDPVMQLNLTTTIPPFPFAYCEHLLSDQHHNPATPTLTTHLTTRHEFYPDNELRVAPEGDPSDTTAPQNEPVPSFAGMQLHTRYVDRFVTLLSALLGDLTGVFEIELDPGCHCRLLVVPAYALTYREVKTSVMMRLTKVDGQVRLVTRYPFGFMDVINLENFRLSHVTQHRFALHKTTIASGRTTRIVINSGKGGCQLQTSKDDNGKRLILSVQISPETKASFELNSVSSDSMCCHALLFPAPGAGRFRNTDPVH